MGKLSRPKGAAFERLVVHLFCHAGLPAKRGYWQARGAKGETSEVVVEGAPLWVECHHGRLPGTEKLDQAIRDRFAGQLAVAVTRRTGSRRIEATMRLGELVALISGSCDPEFVADHPQPVTLDLKDWLPLALAWYERGKADAAR